LPVATRHPEPVETGCVARSSDSRVALNRVSFRPGMASILIPNQGAVMLWQTLGSTAIRLSISLVQSFRRLKAHKQHPILRAALPAGADAEKIEASFKKGVLTVTLRKKPAAQTPEKKIEVKGLVVQH
jgi:Hsp20/alpha crystallin family